MPVVPDELDDPGYAFPGRTPEARPTALAELGGGYAALSTAIVETLTAYCDAPEHCPEQVFVGEAADLVCTSCYSGLLTFVGYLWYPGYIEDVYSEGHQDLAHRLGLPF